jgi:cysteine desulfurase
MIYLDANATEPLRPEARAAMLTALDCVGNPSSVHAAGRTVRRTLEDARDVLAEQFGVQPDGVVFTSGGTEADALAVHALGAGRALIVSATEHDAVRASAFGAAVLPVDTDGCADLAQLAVLLAERPAALVCLMLANNETGTIQPIADAAALCRQYGAWLHVDAVQAAGRRPVSLSALGATSLAISSHKLGGPTGAGALLVAPEATSLTPLFAGGGQERGRRGGTPAVPMIAGFAAAAKAARATASLSTSSAALRDQAEAAAQAEGALVCGAGAARLANTTCLALPGIRADTQVMALDLAGIAVSAGAACSAGKIERSHVLEAMGLGKLAQQAIRVSLPWNATKTDVEAFAQAYAAMAQRFRKARPPQAPVPAGLLRTSC